jgi:uncharacterized membrane protein YedE/YeeE
MNRSASRGLALLSALGAGLLFGVGLILSGMSDPAKVRAFLDLGGRWDPSLAFVMIGAIGVGLVGARLAARRRLNGRPSLLGAPFSAPRKPVYDRRLVLGSLAFGIGWGLSGFCPGPVLVAVGAGSWSAVLFLVAVLAGMAVYSLLQRRPSA